ncbi:MAG: hypothetical protein DRP93_08425 [Candidatus Neomarinimicrobiota bacterium]|nr:MAG: hypothetical protein DRP93_08425 [Candidatus Neomarinimicrobiota bacterium]
MGFGLSGEAGAYTPKNANNSQPFSLANIDFNWGAPDTTGYSIANTQMGPTLANQTALTQNQSVAVSPYQQMEMNMMQSTIDSNTMHNNALSDYQNSFMGQASPYITGFANVTQGLGSMASIYTGFKQLGLMEDQVGIAKDQWAETKSELNRVKGVRTKLNNDYMA